jgi:hypothetical protein
VSFSEFVVRPSIQAGKLRQNFDTIVIPDQAAQQIAQGYRAGVMPPRFVEAWARRAPMR